LFTGIIEEIGRIQSIKRIRDAIEFKIMAKKILTGTQIGDSISINGVCLTVTSLHADSFSVDVMPETVHSTSLDELKEGSKVNLERAMSANGRFGGHFVSGHVDGIGEIIEKYPVANAMYYKIKIPKQLINELIYKGSIAVDGTSLTIFGISDNCITVSLIPHTRGATVLGEKNVGEKVNIETDIIGKYVKQFISPENVDKAKKTISKSFLEEHGFK